MSDGFGIGLSPRTGLVNYYDVGSTATLAESVTARIRASALPFSAHQVRHTYACRVVEAGVSLATVQRLLGHSTVVMTQRYAPDQRRDGPPRGGTSGWRCKAVAGLVTARF